MILFLLRSAVLVHLLALELWLLGRAGSVTPDLSAVLVAFCLFDVRPARVPYVLIPLAVARSVLHPGGLSFQLWVLLVAYVTMLPLKVILFRERWQTHMAVGLAIALVLALLQGSILTESGVDPMRRGIVGLVLTGVVTPGALLALCRAYRGVASPRDRPVAVEAPA